MNTVSGHDRPRSPFAEDLEHFDEIIPDPFYLVDDPGPEDPEDLERVEARHVARLHALLIAAAFPGDEPDDEPDQVVDQAPPVAPRFRLVPPDQAPRRRKSRRRARAAHHAEAPGRKGADRA